MHKIRLIAGIEADADELLAALRRMPSARLDAGRLVVHVRAVGGRGRAMSVFLDRARAALSRRMFPHTGVHLKQLAHALGKSEDTAARLVRGEAQLSAADVYALMRLFGPAFIAEVYQEAAILSPRDRKALEIGRRALEIAEQAA